MASSAAAGRAASSMDVDVKETGPKIDESLYSRQLYAPAVRGEDPLCGTPLTAFASALAFHMPRC